MDQVEEVKSKVDIVQLAGEYVKLAKAGRNFKGLCPFHGEKTPSFMVNPELQIYKCFGCGEGGDAYSFLQKMEGMEFGEALKTLAKRAGVTLVSYTPSRGEEDREKLYTINSLAAEFFHYLLVKHPKGEQGREYLEERKIGSKAIETYKLGYVPEGWDYLMKYLAGKKGFKIDDLTRAGLAVEGRYDRFRNRIMFPLNNHRGQTVGFAGRVMPGGDEKSGKYVNTPETEIYHKGDLLYGLDVNRAKIKGEGTVVVVEGEIDAIASWQAGVSNVVALKGSALTAKQVDILKRYTQTAILSLDADLAGDMAARRGIEIAEKAGLLIKVINPKSKTLNPKNFKDPGDFATEDPKGWNKAVAGAVPIYDYYIDSAVERYGMQAEGKKKISRELIPIWAGIDDEIVKAHYVNRLANELGVEARAVWAQIQKTPSPGTVTQKSGEKTADDRELARSRRDVVEENLVKLSILGEKVNDLDKSGPGKMIRGGFWRRVVEEFGKGKSIGELPSEIKPRVQELMMDETEFSQAEWEETIRQLELVGIEEEMEEDRHDPAKIKKLGSRKAELTKGR